MLFPSRIDRLFNHGQACLYFSKGKEEEGREIDRFSKRRNEKEIRRCRARLTFFTTCFSCSKFASNRDATRLARFHAMRLRDNSRKRARYTLCERGSIFLYRDLHLGPRLSNEPTTIIYVLYTCEARFFSLLSTLSTHTHTHTTLRELSRYRSTSQSWRTTDFQWFIRGGSLEIERRVDKSWSICAGRMHRWRWWERVSSLSLSNHQLHAIAIFPAKYFLLLVVVRFEFSLRSFPLSFHARW